MEPSSRLAFPWLRVASTLAWMVVLWGLSAIALLFAASRVGEDASTSFGDAMHEFQASWGGRLDVSPPRFVLKTTTVEDEWDKEARAMVPVTRVHERDLYPVDAILSATLDAGDQRAGSLTVSAYEARLADRYVVANLAGVEGELFLHVRRPKGAALLYDYALTVDGQPVADARLGEEFRVLEAFAPGAEVAIGLQMTTKGVEEYRFRLSEWSASVLPHLKATFQVDTDRFRLLRFGVPHQRTNTEGASTVVFEANRLAADQDLGVSFLTDRQVLERVADVVIAAPLATGLFLVVVLVWSQVRGVRFSGFHFVFVATIPTFYFLFLAYLVRFVGLPASLGAAVTLLAVLFAATLPPVFGRAFALKVVLPYLLVLTLGFTAVFLLPLWKGLALLGLLFAVGLSVMVPLARADFEKWPLLAP